MCGTAAKHEQDVQQGIVPLLQKPIPSASCEISTVPEARATAYCVWQTILRATIEVRSREPAFEQIRVEKKVNKRYELKDPLGAQTDKFLPQGLFVAR